MSYARDHDAACLMRRYVELPPARREWFPPAFSGRTALCTCGLYPTAEAIDPDYAKARQELEEYLSHE